MPLPDMISPFQTAVEERAGMAVFLMEVGVRLGEAVRHWGQRSHRGGLWPPLVRANVRNRSIWRSVGAIGPVRRRTLYRFDP